MHLSPIQLEEYTNYISKLANKNIGVAILKPELSNCTLQVNYSPDNYIAITMTTTESLLAYLDGMCDMLHLQEEDRFNTFESMPF